MKRNLSIIIFMFIIGMLIVTGCHKDKVTDPAPEPDSTMSISVDFLKSADTVSELEFIKNTRCIVSVLYIGTGSLQGVKVTINGINIPYDSVIGGYVLNWNSDIITGSTVKLDVTSSQGNYSASGVLPAAGAGKVQITIPGCIPGSYLSLAHT